MAAVAAVLVRCALLVAGSSLVGALCSQFGVWMLAVFTSVGFGLLALSIPAGLMDDSKTPTFVVGFIALVVVSAVGFLAMAMVEHRLWPGTAADLTVDQAAQHPWASAFRFRDAVAHGDLRGSAPVWGGRSGRRRLDTLYAVPVVASGWTADHPVAVWAVANDKNFDERAARWKEPARAGARIVGMYRTEYLAAVQAACSRHRLTATDDPVLIDWTATPDQSMRDAWSLLLTIAGIGAALVLVTVATAWLFAPARS